jgi:Domain of unknown function (DUF4136)
MKNLVFLSYLLVLMSSCNAYTDIYSTTSPDAKFSKYKTFAWLTDKADTVNSPYNNEIIRNNIRNYFSKAMSDRGFQVDTENPDMLLELVVKNTPHTTVTRTYDDNYYRYHRYYYRSVYYSPFRNRYYYTWYPNYVYMRPPAFSNYTDTHMNNSVVLNVVDAKEKKLLWVGSVEADIYDPSVIERDIHPAIEKLMARFPVKPLDKTVAMK